MKEVRILGMEKVFGLNSKAKKDLPEKEYAVLEDMLEISNITANLLLEGSNGPYRAYAICKSIGIYLKSMEAVDSDHAEHIRSSLIDTLNGIE
jgi:hypothetical protein